MANPVPEIMPEVAREAGAAVIATGRFDYPNQCNNVLAFPGPMRGALDTKALRVPREACLAATAAIAQDVSESALAPPEIFCRRHSRTPYNPQRQMQRRTLSFGLDLHNAGMLRAKLPSVHVN